MSNLCPICKTISIMTDHRCKGPKRAEGETQGPSAEDLVNAFEEAVIVWASPHNKGKKDVLERLESTKAKLLAHMGASPGEPKTGDPAREGKSLADRLHEFGYEPGGCMIHCFTCKQTAIADKRAIRCQACAMAKAEAPTPTGAREVDPEDVARYLHAIIGDRREESEPAVVEFLEDTPEAKEQGFTLWATKKAIEALAPAPRGTGEAG